MDLHGKASNFLAKNLKMDSIENCSVEIQVGYLVFDQSVLAKFVANSFYSDFCAGMWPNFGVF